MEQIRVLLADNKELFREGLVKILDGQSHIEVVCQCDNGSKAIEKAKETEPDVVLMDISMPLLNGIEATRQIKKICPQTKVVILSMHSHDLYITELFRLGASGYLLKDSTWGEIVKAVFAAMKGDVYLSPSISRRVIDDYLTLKKTSSQEDLYTQLSNREREVFQMIAEGHSTKKISDILCVSPSTVKTHRANIMDKLQLDNVSKLVQFAIRLGIVDVQSQDIDF